MISEQTKAMIKEEYNNSLDKVRCINDLQEFLHGEVTGNKNPVDLIRWVPLEKVTANDYNPNSVARNEMNLLYTSISHDGYTQPVVTIYDPELEKYVIVDGFHRYTTMREHEDIKELNKGYLPIVVIDKGINDRMASTIRHNRARGKHSVEGMSNIVFNMLDNGMTDAEVCKELGMEIEELIKIKHVTGFSKLFENVEYRKTWETDKQVKLREKWRKEHDGQSGFKVNN